jgi:hypothetical protein
MKTFIWALLAGSTAAFALASCSKDQAANPSGLVDCSKVTFSGDIMPIFQTSCNTTGCHNAGGAAPMPLTNYNEIKVYVDNGMIADRVLVKGDMPPGGLAEEQKKKIKCWIENGAPNN